ncbi:MAG: pantoate--beta-alanine ligase [Pseudomonadota bacterium]|jgi:pantoate--beta-alanine ligase
MQTQDRIGTLREVLGQWRRAGQRIAFVPTMGNLHAGHMSLLEAARLRADRVVASVFVNPLQFGPAEDFTAYPRTPAEDAAMLAGAGCDLLFLPKVTEMYPDGGDAPTRVVVRGLSETLCGLTRPGHFEGVATVVAKLFGIVQPDLAVFGEKDFQQLAVIRRMVADLSLPVQIVGAPTVRAPDGLALSSRNRYLTPAERAVAPALHAALRRAVDSLAGGEADVEAVEAEGVESLRIAGLAPDYFAVRDALSLQPPEAGARALVVLAAARLGKARLIDNLQVTRS